MDSRILVPAKYNFFRKKITTKISTSEISTIKGKLSFISVQDVQFEFVFPTDGDLINSTELIYGGGHHANTANTHSLPARILDIDIWKWPELNYNRIIRHQAPTDYEHPRIMSTHEYFQTGIKYIVFNCI